MEIQRNTAYKLWIADLIRGNYFKGEEQFESGYALVRDKKVSRANLIGVLIDEFKSDTSLSFSLDDGSGVIKLRVWNEAVASFSNLSVGDLVLVVGKVKEYNNAIYVVPDFVKFLDNPLWFKVRKAELLKEYGEVSRIENFNSKESVVEESYNSNVVEEKVSDSGNIRETVLSLIEKLDFGQGADKEEVIKISGSNEASSIIDDLLLQGEIFELDKGKLRVLG